MLSTLVNHWGQLLGWIFRERAAFSWYRTVLPRGANANVAAFRGVAMRALRCGGCFSLPDVVQGLIREPAHALEGIQVPCTVIWGAADSSRRDTDPRSLLQIVPHADVIRLDDHGHFPDLEDAALYSQLLLDAMSRHAAARSGRPEPSRNSPRKHRHVYENTDR